MASDNKTVADIVRELRDNANTVLEDRHDEDIWTNLDASTIYRSLADRIEAAHRREIAELRECLNEAIGEVCRMCSASDDEKRELCDQCIVAGWREALAKAAGEEVSK